jgi:outer membrane protein OmpA-like peptidoglycan-associated protein
MKKILLIVGILSIGFSQAQQQVPTTHYVVIGAFRILNNAIRFADQASRNGHPAQYALRQDRKLYYVYISSDENKKKAYNSVIRIKVETVFKDAWVYSGHLGEEVAQAEPVKDEAVKQVVEPKPDVIKDEKPEPTPVKDSVAIAVTPPVKKDSVAVVKETPPAEIKKPTGKPFYFKLTDESGKEVFGDVEVAESTKAVQFQSFQSGKVVFLGAPANKQKKYTIQTSVAGYKEITTLFSFDDTNAEKGPQGEQIISIKLPKAKKGDYIDFKNVSFFKNTSVLQPQSQNELDGVVNLMKESPKYKIRIHGHCNGNQERESYLMGTSTNFFAMDPTANQKITITSKELSLARAETVKAYLVQQGISASRITTKGEGGRIPIYPEGGTLGEYNDRVEIEFVKN